MKTWIFALALFINGLPTNWFTNFNDAQKIAKEKHKNILVNFSGSDWCGPCIRTRKEIFETDVFKNYSDSNLILVNADFPRQKKNQLSKEQTKLNESLADVYNKKGIFPLTLLLNENGKVLKLWDGFPNVKPTEFVNQIKQLNNVAK